MAPERSYLSLPRFRPVDRFWSQIISDTCHQAVRERNVDPKTVFLIFFKPFIQTQHTYGLQSSRPKITGNQGNTKQNTISIIYMYKRTKRFRPRSRTYNMVSVYIIITSERSERVRYRVEHEKVKFISISEYVIFCLLYKHQ